MSSADQGRDQGGDPGIRKAPDKGVNIVLVHGAWLGAWAWKRVLGPLRAAGHQVFPVTLAGVGERAHQAHADIRLQTHIDDVKAVIECEELTDVLLVGHSYSGMVITGVADQMPDRIARLVYLDAVIPEPGESWSSRHTPETQTQRRELISKFGHLPVTEPHGMGLKPADFDWMMRNQRPQPGGVYDSPLAFDKAAWLERPRTFIDCNRPALLTIAAARERARSQPGWELFEIPTGHQVMVSAPQELTGRLLMLADRQASGT